MNRLVALRTNVTWSSHEAPLKLVILWRFIESPCGASMNRHLALRVIASIIALDILWFRVIAHFFLFLGILGRLSRELRNEHTVIEGEQLYLSGYK